MGIRLANKTRVESIFEKTKAKNIWGFAKELKYRYAGHVIREPKSVEPYPYHLGPRQGQVKQRLSEDKVVR